MSTHRPKGTAIIRCDDIFVDSDFKQFEEICRIIERYDFDHLIGITLLGEGRRLWASRGILWKLPLVNSRLVINRRILKKTGEKYIGDNKQLLQILNSEFNNGAIPALHGLHHYRYDFLSDENIHRELSTGIKLLKELFNVPVKIFAPPFNAWNVKTKLVCEKLGLSIDGDIHGFDTLIRNMNSYQIEHLARKQSAKKINYHPYCLTDLRKFELYLRARRKCRQL